MRPITLDYETFYIKDEYSVKDMGNWRYCHDDRFDPYLLTVYDGEDSWAGHPKDFNWDALEGALLIAHNAAFDSEVTNTLIEKGIAPTWLQQAEWQCTANMSSALFSARALADVMLVAEGETLSKAIRDAMNKQNWASLVKAKMDKQVVDYGLRDVYKAQGLWTKYSPRWSSFEQRLSSLTMKQCRRGVKINADLLREYIQVLGEVIFYFEKSLPWVDSGARPSSKPAIAEQCRKCGIPAPGNKGKKGSEEEEAYLEWERTYRKDFPWVTGACTWRSLRKLLSSFQTIEERLRPDDTVDFSLLYFGGHTGRWSGGGGGFNMQNLRKEPIWLQGRSIVDLPPELLKKENKAALADWKKDKYELDIRKLFVARPGKKFIISDLSQVEPRVLNWLAGNTELLDAMARGYSYYEAYAGLYKGWKGSPGTIKDDYGLENYTLLKNEALGLGFGMGWERYTEYADVSEEVARATVDAFRTSNPKIASRDDGLWTNLEQELLRSTGSDYEIVLPSGRTMTYRNVRRQTRMKWHKEEQKMKSRVVTTVSEGTKRKEVYGGKLAENITQATARDVFGTHLLALEENIGDVIFHVHDEAIVEVEQDVTPRDVEALMSVTPDWLPGCPLGSEAKESQHYLK